MNKKSNLFLPKVRESSLPMVREQRHEYTTLWACIESIAIKIGCVPQTLNDGFDQHGIGTNTLHRQRIRRTPIDNLPFAKRQRPQLKPTGILKTLSGLP